MGDLVNIHCEICFEMIGKADTETLTLPLRGDMFLSPDEAHGYPAPFLPEWPFLEMRCPYGQHRFATVEDRIMTDRGFITIPYKEAQDGEQEEGQEDPTSGGPGEEGQEGKTLTCDVCGKSFRNLFALTGHKRSHR